MKNRELILTALHERLADDTKTQGTVALLSGPWGCGKTHLWLYDLLPMLPKQKTIWLSLFGLESIAALKTQLMNQCLIRKAQSLRGGKVRQALSGGGSLLLEGFKKALKGVDSVIGTNLLSWNIDPLQLVDDDLIVCFDDLERISSKVELEEILGLTNLLAEHKHCKVLLITNEEALLSKSKSNSETMLKYKERVIDYYLQVETDMESAFELFLNQYHDNANAHIYLATYKPFILQTIIGSQHDNLRTLKKCLQMVAEVVSSEDIVLDPRIVPSIVALQIEQDEGKLNDVDFYNFNEMAVLVINKMATGRNGSGEQQSERLQFHRKYFGNSEGYHFVRAFYDRIKYGYFDWSALKDEINPETLPEDSLTSTLAAAQSREWWYLTDEEYARWINEIEQQLLSDRGITTADLMTAVVYLNLASDWSGVPLKPETDLRIRERLDENASSGDETFTHERRMFLSQQNTIWEPYLHGYDEVALAAAVESLVPGIVEAIEKEDFTFFMSQVSQQPKGVLAAVSEAGLQAMSRIFTKNRLLFNDAIHHLIKELCIYRHSHHIPDVDEKLARIHALIDDLLGRPDLGNSDRRRLELLLEKLAAVDPN